MWTDVLDLNEFYASIQGQMTVRLLRARLREVWPNVRGETVLGLGYAAPFLRPFMEEAQRTMAFMPAPQGVLRWPREGRNHTALVDELDLPLPDRSVDRVLLVHAIECTEQPRPFLREIWRVMADGGKLVVVAPTRAGLWSQLDRSPFYQGHPYSPGQVATLLRANMFAPMRQARALFMPPTRSRLATAHGADGRALRPALARPLRRRERDRGRQAALCRHRRAPHAARARRGAAQAAHRPLPRHARRRETARMAKRPPPDTFSG